MKEFVIILYTKKGGEKPVKLFLDSLDVKMRAKVLRSIDLLKRNGMNLREPYTKNLGNGILELRVIQGNNIVRVLYFFMKDEEFQREWQELEPEYNTIQALIDARKERKMTQKQLAMRTGIDQADISKIENGNGNPTLQVLKRLAEGMNTFLRLEFIPKTK